MRQSRTSREIHSRNSEKEADNKTRSTGTYPVDLLYQLLLPGFAGGSPLGGFPPGPPCPPASPSGFAGRFPSGAFPPIAPSGASVPEPLPLDAAAVMSKAVPSLADPSVYSLPSTYSLWPLRSIADPLPTVSPLTYESAVSVHELPSSISTYTSPFWPSVLMAPVNTDLSFRYMFSVDTSSTMMFPSITWPLALRFT